MHLFHRQGGAEWKSLYGIYASCNKDTCSNNFSLKQILKFWHEAKSLQTIMFLCGVLFRILTSEDVAINIRCLQQIFAPRRKPLKQKYVRAHPDKHLEKAQTAIQRWLNELGNILNSINVFAPCYITRSSAVEWGPRNPRDGGFDSHPDLLQRHQQQLSCTISISTYARRSQSSGRND